MKYLLIGFIKLWRLLISPLYGDVCRYYPSCSQYGLDAVRCHGAIKGSWLTMRRITRCTPWHAGGYDPVPGTPEAAEWAAEQERSAAERAAFAKGGPVEPSDKGTATEEGTATPSVVDSPDRSGHTGRGVEPDHHRPTNLGTN